MNLKFTFTAFIFFGLILSEGFAQDCATTLSRAERLYEEGKIEQIKELLTPCIQKGFTPEERGQAYKLIILTYLFEDNQEEAENTMLKFLKRYPEYEILPSDPAEFVYLFKSYRTSPVISAGVTLGTSFTNVRVIEPFDINNQSAGGSYVSAGVGYNIGLRFNRYIWENISIDVEILLRTQKFKFENIFAEFTNPDYFFTNVNYTENQSLLGFPIVFSYNKDMGKVTPYAGIGFQPSLLMKSTAEVNRTYIDNSRLPDVTGPDISIEDNRKKLSYGLLLNGGAKYKLKKSYAFLNIRYDMGLSNVVNAVSRYSNTELYKKYYYLDDDFSINNFSISIGYVISFYNSVKIENK